MIARSPRNRIIDDADPELLELSQSIREHGVLQPILVQQLAGKLDAPYQIIAGERRWRGSILAERTDIPAIVLASMSEVDAYQLTLIENLQRKNLSPLEEAEEYHKLLQTGSTPAGIAGRIGKSVRYVYDRSRLLSLTTEAQELLRAGQIDAGHAVVLARLNPKQQADAIRGGLFDREQLELLPGETYREAKKARTVQELTGWVNKFVRFEKEPDPMLFPETAATLAKAKEEAAKVVSISYDFFVQPEAKDGTRIYGPQSWKPADGTERAKACPHSVIGVVVAGSGRGRAFQVCTDKKKCLVHWGKEIRARQAKEKGTATSKEKGEDRWAKQDRERREQQAREEAKKKMFERSLAEILAAVAERVKKAPIAAESFLIADLLFKRLSGGPKALAIVPAGKTPEDTLRCLAFGVLYESATDRWSGYRDFPALAKALGVDVKAIIEGHEKALAAAAAKKATPTKKKAPAKKATPTKKKAPAKKADRK